MSQYSHAEYDYSKNGVKKIFITKWISTIDNYWGNYKLIRKEVKNEIQS